MRRITLRELNEQYGGILPPDCGLRPEGAAESEGGTSKPMPRPGKPPSPSRPARPKRNPVIAKLAGYRTFFETLPTLEPIPSPGAAALWCWLWTCEKKGVARCSERKLSERFGLVRNTVRGLLDELESSGFIIMARRGQHGKCSTVYRVRPVPKPGPK